MALSGATELIWHFAGYLRLPPEDFATHTSVFDGAAQAAARADDAASAPANQPHGYADYHLHTGLGQIVDLPALTPYHWHAPRIGNHHPPLSHHELHGTKLPLPLKTSVPVAPLDSGGGGDEQLHVSVSYQGGGDQTLIDLTQINLLVNNNQVNAPAEIVALNNDHAAKMLTSMLDKAQDGVAAAQVPDHTTTGLEQYVNARDSSQADAQSHDAPYSIPVSMPSGGEAIFVNHALSTASVDQAHQVTTDALTNVTAALHAGFSGPPAPPTGNGYLDPHQTISVGSDIAVNHSAIENAEPSSAALMVFGNYYETQAIVQTNVVTELDKIALDGAGAGVSIAPNTIENIADFNNPVPHLQSGAAGPAPADVHWSVDMLNGSLLDIHSLVQTNYLINNNVIYSTELTGETQIIAGQNVQANESQFLNLTSKYDLIIVAGNYHQDDMIYQTNVLLDSNTVGVTGNGIGSSSVSGGGNTAINDAAIIDAGNHTFQSMPGGAAAELQSLEAQNPSLDAMQLINAFPQLFGNLNVLVVTGDYYDINYISQTNIISNSNVVMAGGAGPQTVSTGHDQTINSAIIADGGSATSPYLGGTYYNDMILIQTNIISDGTKVTGADPNHLAPEIVAFTGTTDAVHPAAATPVAAPIDLQHHNDPMSSLLH